MTTSDSKSLMSLSSKSDADAASAASLKARWVNPLLHERCTIQDMERLRQAFVAKNGGKMVPDEFRNLLRDLLNVEYDDEEFNILFLKINSNHDGEIDWDQLVSFLLLGYFGNDPDNQRDQIELPILGLPKIQRSMHRHPISRICFCPDVDKDHSTNMMQGNYLTVSSDGMINWWSLDMEQLRSAYSTSRLYSKIKQSLKVCSTWVTDMVCMPDVSIIVTSSTERELRFYDCIAGAFTLKIVISSWEYMICTMHYHFSKDLNEQSKLICGDIGGHVRLLLFSPIRRGPFQSQASQPLITLRHIDLQKRPKMLPKMQLVELCHVHNEWVRQVSFYTSLHCVVSCATCPDALLMCDVTGSKTYQMFQVKKGVLCFTFDEGAHVLVTGGPDGAVQVWNPFVSTKPNLVLRGHNAGVIYLVLQNNGQLVYSLARDRIIKVWDIGTQTCIQTYVNIPTEMGEHLPITAAYNSATRDLIIGSKKIAIITLNEQINSKHTDGFTHSKGVSKLLYNPLFKILVTCGMDSIIINWDPRTGKRNLMIRDAHTRILHGDEIPVEITAACFDPGYQLLLTGARNGTLKVWNFNSGVCLRNLECEHMMEITSVFWVKGRLFAVGWNRHIVEFEDSVTKTRGKPWETRHTDDVMAAVARPPHTVATASYNSELILWKLETGQPYRRYLCSDPTLQIAMVYSKRDSQRGSLTQQSPVVTTATSNRFVPPFRRPSYVPGVRDTASGPVCKLERRRLSSVSLPSAIMEMRKLTVNAMIFLETRPCHSKVASLMISLGNGSVQAWSENKLGGLRGSFQGVHTSGDYVSAFATDINNDYLFTGTTVGYVKVWLMKDYLTNTNVKVSMPALRLEFPFLWRDRIEGRAKRSVRDQPRPLLLNSYRAHLRCITTMAYMDESKLVFTGSSDYSVRVWRLSGEYLQTLGGIVPWTLEKTRFPPDVAKVASFTTFKVWRGGEVSRYIPGQKEVDPYRDITETELAATTYGSLPLEPVLGHHYGLDKLPDVEEAIMLDDSLSTVPLYKHLRLASTTPVRRPPTPELLRTTRFPRNFRRKAANAPSAAAPVVSITENNEMTKC